MVGFTLVELIVAMAVTLSVLGAAVAVVLPATSGFHAIPEHADTQQRLRSVIDTLRADVRSAVAGPVVGGFVGTSAAWPPVQPCGWGWDPVSGVRGPCARPDVLSVVLVDRPLQVTTTQALADAGDPIPIDRPPGCAAGLAGCQFERGDHCLIADGFGAADAFDLGAVSSDGAWLAPAAGALSRPYRARSAVMSARVRSYSLRDDPATGAWQLCRIEGPSVLPVLDHITAFAVEYFGDPDPPVAVPGPNGDTRSSYGPRPPDGTEGAGSGAWPPGENCLYRQEQGHLVSRLLPRAAGADGLAPLPLGMLADGPWCPDETSPARYDADLFRIRRVEIAVRVQAASAASRGSSTVLFRTPGSARSALRLVPDLGVRVDIAVRAGR